MAVAAITGLRQGRLEVLDGFLRNWENIIIVLPDQGQTHLAKATTRKPYIRSG
jgi:hypothetical protein